MTFDLINTPLNKGITRIEASAGTGKTYTLTGLFLRLVLEENIPAEKILVVTFTKAATAELRDRIRTQLNQARMIFKGKSSPDALLRDLAARLAPGPAVESLGLALGSFDEVSVYTIHGFCERTLQDRAFESGILFDVELTADQEDLLREVAADYFRQHIYPSDPLLASVALRGGLTPDILAKMLDQYLTYPGLVITSTQPARSLDAIADDLRAKFKECQEAGSEIARDPEALVRYFIPEKQWATGAHNKPESIREQLAKLNGGYDSAAPSSPVWAAIEFFSTSAIEQETGASRGMKKPRPQPQPPLFACCQSLRDLAAEYLLAHRLEFLKSARDQLQAHKQQAKQQSFDDLITGLAGALDGPSGSALAQSVRENYRAALIDEFQDTDPLQWSIFHRIFGTSPDHWLYLIGDPKQAIYGFRGADVGTYVQAAATAKHKFDLDTNWRSESALVRSVNTLFVCAGKKTAFGEEGIEFEEVKAAGKADERPLEIEGRRLPPLRVWCCESEKESVTVAQAKKQVPQSVAAEISRLLIGACRLRNRPLQPRDIAVLVESHRQADWIQSALHSLQIPSVELAMESVFKSDDARELQWILMAILEPSRESRVKSALTTDTLGWTGDALQARAAQEADWQGRLLRFVGYRNGWEQHGFFFMFSGLLREEQVMERLLRLPDGERRITNLLHLAELLEAASQERHLDPLRLVQWLEARRVNDEAAAEAYQLRLESDEDAVRIVTIHSAKGLEYPVVFCPFFQRAARLRPLKANYGKSMIEEVVLYHDFDTKTLMWDLGPAPAESHRQQALKEQLAEKMRLLYVALTRACHRCYLVSARYSHNKATPLAWLLYPDKEQIDDPVAALNDPKKSAPNAWRSRWDAIAAASVDPSSKQPAIEVSNLPLEPGRPWRPPQPEVEKLRSQTCSRNIEPTWRLSSFSQLATHIASAHAALAEDQPDRDPSAPEPQLVEIEDQTTVAPAGIFALPPGVRTGDCLHKILEQFDFASRAVAATTLIKKQLETYAFFGDAHAQAVCDMLERVRHTPLDPDFAHFTLSRISRSERLTELEFHFPAGHLDGAQLLEVIRDSSSPPSLPAETRFRESVLRPGLEGFLKGFIDLIFQFEGRYYIVDWKSNRLGNPIEDYHQEAMQRAVTESCYDLQYHLYTVALDKYLRLRLPGYSYEAHFGGVRYIFLRGVDPDHPELGVYRDRPTAARIARLSALLDPIGKTHS